MSGIEVEFHEITELITFIREKYKFDFGDYAASSFKRRLLRFLDLYKLYTVTNLINRLSSDKLFFEVFLKEVTVNTTEMYRDPLFWKALKKSVFPVFENLNTIRIWHSACSTGEEVFSMSIALKEAGLYEKAKIYASDINEDVISKALSRRYYTRNMELNELNYIASGGCFNLSNYYEQSGDSVIMDVELLRNVTFERFDLVLDQQHLKFDLILCRNVLIYFNLQLQDKLIDKFFNNLEVDGFLALGAQETIAFCKSSEKCSAFLSENKIFKKG